jgi:hypothetical protein
MRGYEQRGSLFGKEAEEGMDHQGLILIDGGSDAKMEAGLSQGNGNASIGNVAGGAKQLAAGEMRKAECAGQLRPPDRAAEASPDTAEDHLGVFRGAE